MSEAERQAHADREFDEADEMRRREQAPDLDLAVILSATAKQMGMDFHAFQAKYLTDAAFHALATVHVAALERPSREAELVAVAEAAKRWVEYMDSTVGDVALALNDATARELEPYWATKEALALLARSAKEVGERDA